MRRTPLLLLAFLFFLPCSLVHGNLDVRDVGEELEISLVTGNLNPLESGPELFICGDYCYPLEVKSFTYSHGHMNFFTLPAESGDFLLKVYLTDDGERICYEKNITVSRIYASEKPEVKKAGITSNIVNNSSSPVFFFGLLGFLVLFFIFKTRGLRFQRRFITFSRSEIKILFVFLVSFAFISSFTHEFFHIFLAGFFGCPAVLDSFIPLLTPTSVSLNLCKITSFQSILILGAGVVGNLFLGLFLLVLSRLKDSKLISSISLAFFTSSFFYLFYSTGDIHNILRIIGTEVSQLYLNLAGIGLISLSFWLFLNQKSGTYPRYHRNM